MRLLTLPIRLWYAIAVVWLIVTWLSHATLSSGGMEHMRKQTRPEVKAAIMRCGPNYHYRTLYDGTLQVNRGRGWERLRV